MTRASSHRKQLVLWGYVVKVTIYPVQIRLSGVASRSIVKGDSLVFSFEFFLQNLNRAADSQQGLVKCRLLLLQLRCT